MRVFRFILLLLPLVVTCGVSTEISNTMCEDIVLPDYYTHQSMAIINNSALFITPIDNQQLVCDIYDIKKREYTCRVILPTQGYGIPHANVSIFSRYYYDKNSIYPCLYVSQWSGKRMAFVYDFKEEKSLICANLVQVIDPSSMDEAIIGSGFLDWVIDEEGAFIYAVAYKRVQSDLDSTNNAIHITKFRLPNPKTEHHVILRNEDVIDSFVLPIINATQDKCFHDEYLYIVSGYPNVQHFFPNCLYRIDLKKQTITTYNILLKGEPEGLSNYKGQLLLNMYGSDGILYYLENYLETVN